MLNQGPVDLLTIHNSYFFLHGRLLLLKAYSIQGYSRAVGEDYWCF